MKCNEDCSHWNIKTGECDGLSTDLGGDCLLRHVLWQLEFMTGILEAEGEDETQDGDEWKQ